MRKLRIEINILRALAILFTLIGIIGFCNLVNGQITITVTLSGTPNHTTKVVPADLKYNKYGQFDFTQDDRGNGAYWGSFVLSGGTATLNGVTYTPITFTDGANNRAQTIAYSGSVATNSFWNTDTTQDWEVNFGAMTWPQMAYVVSKGWSILDHGGFHGVDQPGPVALGLDPLKNAFLNRNYIYRKMSEQGTPYVTDYGVVPTNDPGYHSAWEQMGYVGGNSENQFDNYTAEPIAEWWNYGLAIVDSFKTDNRYHVQARRFKDLNTGDAVAEYKLIFDSLIAQSTSTQKRALSYGIHQFNIDTFKTIMQYLHDNAADEIWVCGLQEFYEYFKVIQQTNIKQAISGNTLTITLDQSFLPDETRWRDMSFLLSSNVSISSVTVTGADDYSYNTTTGLINVYKKKTTGFATPPYYNATGFSYGRVPLEKRDVFIDNNFGDYYDNTLGINVQKGMLVDSNTTYQYHARLFDGSMIYTPYEAVIDLTDYGVMVDSVRIYRSNTTGFSTKAILVRNDDDVEDSIGVWSSGSGWITFSPTNKYVSQSLILRSNSTGGFGNEVEVYGRYLPYTEQTYSHRHAPLGQMLGVNSYVWDFIESNQATVNEVKVAAFNSMHLRSLRDYGDARFYPQNGGATYSFDPLALAYHEDKMLRRLKQDNPLLVRWNVLQGQTDAVKQNWRDNPTDVYQIRGKVVSYTDNIGYGTLVVSAYSGVGGGGGAGSTAWRLQGTATNGLPTEYPEHFVAVPTSFPTTVTFFIPAGLASSYDVNDTVWARSVAVSQLNIMYANNTDAGRGTLATWDSVARLSYVYSARRGRDTNATKYIPFTDVAAPWLDNNDSVGLNTSEWTELMNEPNAWWGGYNDYLNGKYLSTAWSKIYDNNKTYSTTLGAKNADTSMVVSTSGLAINTVDLNRSAEIYARRIRGGRAKKSVVTQPTYWKAQTFGWTDNPFNVIQFHNYSYTGGADQYGSGVNSGLPIELSPSLPAVDEFVWFRNKYAPDGIVDVGEWGLDIHSGSPMNVPAIGSHNAEQVRGAWAIRTMLEYNVHGVDYAQWYRLYSTDSTATQFSTMHLLRYNEDNTITRKLVGNNFAQLSEFSDYIYDATLRSDSIRVYRFKKDTSYLYAIWGVENWTNPLTSTAPTGTEKATFTERTGTYTLPLPNGTPVHTRRFQDNTTVMTDAETTVLGSGYAVAYNLVPIFVQTGVSNRKKRTIVYF